PSRAEDAGAPAGQAADALQPELDVSRPPTAREPPGWPAPQPGSVTGTRAAAAGPGAGLGAPAALRDAALLRPRPVARPPPPPPLPAPPAPPLPLPALLPELAPRAQAGAAAPGQPQGAGAAVTRSSRAPRAERVRSQEWRAAAAAVEAARDAAAAAVAAAAASREVEGLYDWVPGAGPVPAGGWVSPPPSADGAAGERGWGPQQSPPPVQQQQQQPAPLPQREGRSDGGWMDPAAPPGLMELERGTLDGGGLPYRDRAGGGDAALELPMQSWSDVAISEPQDVVVLGQAGLRGALAAAAAEQRMGPGGGGAGAGEPAAARLPREVDRTTWHLHARALFPDLYDAEWHGGLFDFLFDLWPEVGRAHATAGGEAPGSRRLLLTTDAELMAVLAAEMGDGGGASAAAAAAAAAPPSRRRQAAAFLDAAYRFAARCAESRDFSVSSALVISALDCMEDHDALIDSMAARLPPGLVRRVMSPLAPHFQPPWVVEEWEAAVATAAAAAYGGGRRGAAAAPSPTSTAPPRWYRLLEVLAKTRVVHGGVGGLAVLHAA
ncbi:hypothetical protein TSOC_014871, partial [Tetrabaena socialis]